MLIFFEYICFIEILQYFFPVILYLPICCGLTNGRASFMNFWKQMAPCLLFHFFVYSLFIAASHSHQGNNNYQNNALRHWFRVSSVFYVLKSEKRQFCTGPKCLLFALNELLATHTFDVRAKWNISLCMLQRYISISVGRIFGFPNFVWWFFNWE